MWDKAVDWAKKQASPHHRRNEVHGEEELKLVLNERFRATQKEEVTEQEGRMELQAQACACISRSTPFDS